MDELTHHLLLFVYRISLGFSMTESKRLQEQHKPTYPSFLLSIDDYFFSFFYFLSVFGIQESLRMGYDRGFYRVGAKTRMSGKISSCVVSSPNRKVGSG